MSCDSILEEGTLYLYGELSGEEEEALEQHLEACGACRAEIARLGELRGALDRRQVEPSPALLAECREALMRRVERSGRPGRSWLSLPGSVGSLFHPVLGLRQLAAAIALVTLGFVAATVSSRGGFLRIGNEAQKSAGLVPLGSDGVVSGIRATPAGQVQIDLDQTNRRVVKGTLEDQEIRSLLLRAARDQANPGLRVESVTLLKDMSQNAQVRQALLQALAHDPNPGVRLKALEGLRPFASEPQVRDALTEALKEDENSGVRIEAIDVLTQDHDEALVGVLQALVQSEQNNYIKLRCKKVLRDMNASVGAF
jgi:anti-sigma factor RsiW